MKAFVLCASALAVSIVACSSTPKPQGATDSGIGDTGVVQPAKSPIGGPCKTLADCVDGAGECNSDPDGQCTKACQTDKDCYAFPGAICEIGGGNCYHRCTTTADCASRGPAYACVGGIKGHKFCDPRHEVGGSCDSVADCADGFTECNTDPGGQCTKPDCTKQADCDGLPGGAICETVRPGNCYKECTSKTDCPRDGYDCLGGPNAEGKMWCDIIPAVSDAGAD